MEWRSTGSASASPTRRMRRCAPLGQRQAQVAQLAVDLDRGRGIGQARADCARGVEAACAVGKLELVAVGEDRRRHTPECR